MNEDKGSAEQQALQMEERATEAKAQWRPREGEGYGTTEWETRGRAKRRFGRGLLTNPSTPLVVGLLLLGGIALAIAAGEERERHGLRLLGRRARGLAEAFREPDIAVQPRVLATLTRLAAIGLAGLTWRWVRAIGRDRFV
jgi:hypothetical protein